MGSRSTLSFLERGPESGVISRPSPCLSAPDLRAAAKDDAGPRSGPSQCPTLIEMRRPGDANGLEGCRQSSALQQARLGVWCLGFSAPRALVAWRDERATHPSTDGHEDRSAHGRCQLLCLGGRCHKHRSRRHQAVSVQTCSPTDHLQRQANQFLRAAQPYTPRLMFDGPRHVEVRHTA
jgi:hypothetical protein